MRKHALFMTFPSNKMGAYGFAIKGYARNWPKEVKATALVEDSKSVDKNFGSQVQVFKFDDYVGKELAAFEKRNTNRELGDLATVGNIDRQASKFARKAFAIIWALKNTDCDYLHFVDADLYTHRKLPMEVIRENAEGDFLVGCLPRWWKHDRPLDVTEGNILLEQSEPCHRTWIPLTILQLRERPGTWVL